MTAVFLRSWGCRLLKGGVGWRGGAGIFRFPPKLTVSHFQMEVEDFFLSAPIGADSFFLVGTGSSYLVVSYTGKKLSQSVRKISFELFSVEKNS